MTAEATRASHEALRRLAAAPSRVTGPRLWRALTAEERTAATLQCLEERPEQRSSIVSAVAKARHFRPATLTSWPDGKLASAFAYVPVSDPQQALNLLIDLHVPSRKELLVCFLDALGIPHSDGIAEDGALESTEVDPALFDEAVGSLKTLADERKVLTYLLTLSLNDWPLARALLEWLDGRTFDDISDTDEALGLEDLDSEPATAPEDVDDFTTLDKQLIYAVVDAAQGIEGALDVDEIDDLVDEVIHLNGRRHRSYFHAGFRDVLLGRDTTAEGSETNATRARWYWAGVIQGAARAGEWGHICRLLDEEDLVRGLGDGADGPSHAATRFIVQALFEAGRPAEVPSFVSARALIRWPEVFVALLRGGTKVLRSDQAADARGVFDLLSRVVAELERLDGSVEAGVFREARRRHAHCLRQVGEFVRAERALEELLETESSPEMRAMLLADLGLIDGRLRRLADIRLPPTIDERDILLEALSRGEARFQEAVALDAEYSAHARFCLGVEALLDEEVSTAVAYLESARAMFLSRRERYAGGDLIKTTDLCLGIALCLSYREESMSHAIDLIVGALRSGLVFPEYLLPMTLEAMALASPDARSRLSDTLLDCGGEPVLDALSRSEAGRDLPALADALLERAARSSRRPKDRATDLRAAFQLLRDQERHEEAGEVLDKLEGMAIAGTGGDEFVDMLDDPSSCEPVWSIEDVLVARAHVLESLGRCEQAASLLTDVFHRRLSFHDSDSVDDAAGILERIERFGLGDAFVDPLHGRLAGAMPEETTESPESSEEMPVVRVLMVGGDERQEKRDARLERELRSRAPHVEVTFLRTGWSGNWSQYADEFRRKVPGHDAVVIMRFIRTELGKQIRRACEVPWRSCWGAGREQAIRAILRAANAASPATEEASSQ